MLPLIAERYQVLHSLGNGSFTKTFLAKDLHRHDQGPVVLKQLCPVQQNRSFVRLAQSLFDQEIQILQELGQSPSLPTLVTTFEDQRDQYFEDQRDQYLVQEFIPGPSLQDSFNQGKLWTETTLLTFLKDALEVLALIHGAGVIHRDLKPEHWIQRSLGTQRTLGAQLSPDHRLILIDFGAAQRMEPQAAMSLAIANRSSRLKPSLSIGTSSYMAPEQGQGYAEFSSDLYSLGLIALQGITGIEPTQLERNAQGEIRWQPYFPLSRGVMDVLTRMVRYQVSDRYRSATDVLRDLQQTASSSQWSRISQWLSGGSPKRSRSNSSQLHTEWAAAQATLNQLEADLKQDLLNPHLLGPHLLEDHFKLEAQQTGVETSSRSSGTPQVLLSVLGEVPGTLLAALEEAVSTHVWFADSAMTDLGQLASQRTSLEAALRSTDVFVVCLTPESIQSPALLQQLQLFERIQLERRDRKARLLPIRINLGLEVKLSAELRQALQQVRQYLWRSPDDTSRILHEICGLKETAEPEPKVQILSVA